MAVHVSAALERPGEGDWIRYRVLRASEWIPVPVDTVTVVVGPRTTEGLRWQMKASREDGSGFLIDVVSDRAPMTSEDGDIGRVYSYGFRPGEGPLYRYVDRHTGAPKPPIYGFREGLIPTPRSRLDIVGPFLGTGAYLGQLLTVDDFGGGAALETRDDEKIVRLDDDLLIGTARTIRDDGTGKDPTTGDYRYVPLSREDVDRQIEAGFNLYLCNRDYVSMVRDRDVYFILRQFSEEDPYPDLLYRSNFWGPAMFADEPAIRVNSQDCASIHAAAALLRLRNHAYFLGPSGSPMDRRPTRRDAVVRMILAAGFGVGDWFPEQTHVPVWETIHESAFYQLQGGAAGIVHEGRYHLRDYASFLEKILGEGVELDESGMFDMIYAFLRGAARSFDGDWGTAIYGQADFSIAPQAIRQAYDMGARYIWFWTSDHDHHLPFDRQLELARSIREHQKTHPRDRRSLVRAARVAVALPDGYIAQLGLIWKNPKIQSLLPNPRGVLYGDVIADAYWEAYRLLKQGVPFDFVLDVPEVVDRVGYERIIRISPAGGSNLPAPTMPGRAPELAVEDRGPLHGDPVREDAPRTTARFVPQGAIRIDGKLDDWADAEWIEPKERFMYGHVGEKWNGPQDLSAQAAFAYDEEALYLAVNVRDDVFHAPKSGDAIWMNDGIQVAFDPLLNDPPEGFYADDDVEIGISLVDGEPVAYRWHGPEDGDRELRSCGARFAVVREGDRTIYEARIPFTAMAPLSPTFPGRCRMSLLVNDNDGEMRKGAVGWTDGIAEKKLPASFGLLTFEPSPEVRNVPPMLFILGARTVVRRGEPISVRIDSGALDPARAEALVTIRSGERAVPIASSGFEIPSGTRRLDLRIDSSDLESAVYRMEIVLSMNGREKARRTMRVYVLPASAP